MSTTKKTATAAKKETEVKATAPVVETKAEAAKAPATEAKASATEAKASATEVKAPATEAKATVEKKAAAKKETKTTTVKKATTTKDSKVDVKIAVQFADKSYTTEDLVKIANDVWVYDYGKKASELKDVQLYVKPEEAKVYYVFNGEIVGDFVI